VTGRHRIAAAPRLYSVGDLAFLVAIFVVPTVGAVVVPLLLGGWLL
jgi:hypothetical protein